MEEYLEETRQQRTKEEIKTAAARKRADLMQLPWMNRGGTFGSAGGFRDFGEDAEVRQKDDVGSDGSPKTLRRQDRPIRGVMPI